MKTPYQIVIPLHHGGGKFRNDTELRFALRSIEKHFTDPYEIVIVSRKLPAWLSGVKHIYGKGLKSSLVAAAEAFPDGFFWYYDDCVLIRDTTADEMKITPACKGWQKPRTGWARKLDSIRARLVAQGVRPWDYSRPHGPYWFDKGMVDEGFADWPGMEAKFPWESWILSKRDWPRVHGSVKQYYGSFKGAPASGQRYVNYSDAGNTPELRSMLEKFFPDPSRYESGERMQSIVHQKGASVEVHTIRFGGAWWVKFCAPTLDQWCRKNGYHLRVWDADDIPADYPTAKFCQIDMLREFLAGDSEWLLYVDADVYVHPEAGGFPVDESLSGFMIRPDRPSKFSRSWPKWCGAKFGRRPSRSWVYRNAGVWACDRKAAEAMLAVISPPYHEAVQEQHQWNWWIACAAGSGMRVSDLPQGWNNWPSEDTPGSFYHLCGRKKYAKVCSLRDRGLIPRDGVGQWEFDQVFDYSPYRFAHCGTHMPMDEYHIQLLYAACTLGGRDKVAVEIGSYRGASTAAMIEAVNQGWIRHLHVVEIKPTDALRKVIGMCKYPDRVTLHTRPSWEIEIDRPDLVFVDGDHKWPAVGDVLRAVTWGSSIICMHDSKTYPTIAGTWGARLAAGLLAEMQDREKFEDSQARDGMLTYRGFFVSCVKWVDMAPLRALRCYRVDSPEMEDEAGFDDEEEDDWGASFGNAEDF